MTPDPRLSTNGLGMTARATASTTAEDGDQRVVMRGVGWKGYSAVRKARGSSNQPRLAYLDGDLFLMSPAFSREFLKKRLGQFVTEVVVGLNIPCAPSGQTTFRRRKQEAGVEGDETLYLGNEPRIRGKTSLHLRRDPPPDLAIEAVNTHDAGTAVEAWRRFGVPEVWVCGGQSLQILALDADGQYAKVKNSVAFPFLSGEEILGWITRPPQESETAWIKQLRQWVADTLAQRLHQNR